MLFAISEIVGFSVIDGFPVIGGFPVIDGFPVVGCLPETVCFGLFLYAYFYADIFNYFHWSSYGFFSSELKDFQTSLIISDNSCSFN